MPMQQLTPARPLTLYRQEHHGSSTYSCHNGKVVGNGRSSAYMDTIVTHQLARARYELWLTEYQSYCLSPAIDGVTVPALIDN